MLASTYPVLSLFWSMLMFFGLILWIFLVITIFIDIFRSHDIGGFAKAMWVIFIVFLPILGVLFYLIARGGSMHERSVREATADKAQFDDYVRTTAGAASPAEQLATIASLHDQGKLNDEDFAKAKAQILA
jgi:ABC-type multidrug transport system fused ATPase/permease subunit